MARARNIKPGFFKNELLAELPPLTRILFVGLWCIADREGRLEDRPKRIRAEVLPYDDGSVEDMLDELNACGFIVRYIIDGQAFIEIPNFTKHQNPHCKEQASTIPPYTKPGASMVQARCKHGSTPEVARLIPDSLLLIPEVNTCSPDGERARIEKPKDRFDEFWKAYPRKQAKAQAQKAWKKAHINGDFDSVVAALTTQAAACTDLQFFPLASTWLNGRRWEDELIGKRAQSTQKDWI